MTKLNDGAFENAVTGLGHKEMDKTEHTHAKIYGGANLVELASMKIQDGLSARVVECVPEAAFKQDVSIIGDEDGKIFDSAAELGLLETLQNAGEDQRLTGGAVIVTQYDGEDETEEALKQPPQKNAKVTGYRTYSAGKVDLRADDFVGDRLKIVRVTRLDSKTIELNPERCTIIHGKRVPDCIDAGLTERFFGSSALKQCESSIKDLASVTGNIVNMADETGVMLCSLDNLNEMLSKPDNGVEDLHRILSTLKLSMNSMRMVFAGNNDKFQILSHNFAGVADIWQKLVIKVSADSGIPISILFGQSATGLAQTNEGDVKAYGELVENWRSRYMYRPAVKLIRDIALRNHAKKLGPFEWGPVSVMTIKEKLEAMKLQAETLNLYYQMGAIDAESVRKSIFLNGHSWDVSVSD